MKIKANNMFSTYICRYSYHPCSKGPMYTLEWKRGWDGIGSDKEGYLIKLTEI